MPQAISRDTLRRLHAHIANLGSLDSAVAESAERRLIRFGAKALEPLRDATRDPDPQVRFRAVWALGKTRDPRALPAIISLTSDPDQRVAYDAIMALGEQGELPAADCLRELAARPEDERSLVSASRMALAKLGYAIAEEEKTNP